MLRQRVEARTLYLPLVGLCIILAQGIDLLMAAPKQGGGSVVVPRILRGSVAVIARAAVIACAMCSVGVQSCRNRRVARDEATAVRLPGLVPNPPPDAA